MTDYQGNSHKEKEGGQQPEKKIERITNAEVVIQKQGPWRKFKGMIIEADMGSVGRYIWIDLVIPTIKNVIVDIVEQGIKRTVYGDRRASYRTPSSVLTGREQRISYDSRSIRNYNPDPRGTPQLPPISRSSAQDARGYIIATREDAEEVLEMLADVIDRYEKVTVADLHEMLGLDSTHVDQIWGWLDVRRAQIRQIREGWILELPDPVELRY